MTHHRAAILLAPLCLLIAQTASAQIDAPQPLPYRLFSTSGTFTDPAQNPGGGPYTAIEGFSNFIPSTDSNSQYGYTLTDPVTVTDTWTTGSSWTSGNMYVYNGSTINVNGGDPNDLVDHPGGHIGGIDEDAEDVTVYAVSLQDTSKFNLSESGQVDTLIADDMSTANISGGTIGTFVNNQPVGGLLAAGKSTTIITGGNFPGGITLQDSATVIINSSNSTIGGIDTGDTVGFGSAPLYNATVNVSGGEIGSAFISNGVTMNVTGGHFGEVQAANGGTVNVNGGALSGSLDCSSFETTPTVTTATFDGGTVAGLGVSAPGAGSATLNMGGGQCTGDATASANGYLVIEGGTINGNVSAADEGAVDLNHGTIGGGVTVSSNGSINVAAVNIAKDVTNSGGTLNINAGASIAGNLFCQNGQTTINGGAITGLLTASGSAVVSLVGGNIGKGLIANTSAIVTISGTTVTGGTSFAFNSAEIFMTGGQVDNLQPENSSVINFSGGTDNGFLAANNSATVFISGGADVLGAVNALGSSHIFIGGGGIGGGINARNNSTVTFTGGNILFGVASAVHVYDNAKFIWQGGTITSSGVIPHAIPLGSPASSPVPIYVDDNGALEVDGVNLSASLIDPNNSGGAYSEYQVSGFFGDGTPVPSGAQFFLQNATGGAAPPTFQVVATPQVWNTAGGSWSTAANWAPQIIADNPSAVATFDSTNNTGPVTVTLDGNHTVGTLNLQGPNQFTIAQGSSGTLTLSNNGSDASINVTGNHQILAPLMAHDNTDVTISAGSSLTLAGGITVAAGKTLSLPQANVGTLTIPNNSTVNGDMVTNSGLVEIEGGTVTGQITAQANSYTSLVSGSIQGGLNLTGLAFGGVFDGQVTGGVQTADESFFQMTGGTIDGLELHDFSQALFAGGEVDGDLDAFDRSSTTFYTGSTITGDINLHNSAIFTMQGIFPGSAASPSAGVHPLTGPAFTNAIYVNDGARLDLSGINLSTTLIDAHSNGGMYSEYQFSGYYADGSAIPSNAVFFVQNSTGASFRLLGSGQQWNVDSGGSWSSAANWDPAIVPTGISQIAYLDSTDPQQDAPVTIALDGNRTLGNLNFFGEEPFIIVPGTGGSLTLNNNNYHVVVDVTGHHEIDVPVIAQDELTNIFLEADSDPITGLPNNSSLTLTAGITVAANQELQILGPGTLATAFLHGGSRSSLIVRDGGKLAMIPNGTPAAVSIIQSFLVDQSSGAVIDLANNSIIFKSTASSYVLNLIFGGYAGGTWSGSGIITSMATSNTAIGFLTGAEFLRLNPGKMFEGNTVASTDVLIKYTLDGDTNLDGIVDANDYLNIDNGFNQQSTNSDWSAGDSNYDGLINGDDYTLIDNAFNTQGFASNSVEPAEMIAADTAQIASSTAVPEPTILGLICMAASLSSRRWRRST